MVPGNTADRPAARAAWLRRILDLVFVPALAAFPYAPGVDYGWAIARERAFTIILRIQLLFGMVAFASVMPAFIAEGVAETGLILLGVVGLFFVLGAGRRVRYPLRIGAYLVLLYLTGLFEVINFGFSLECFMFFLMFTILAPLLSGRKAAALAFFASIITLGFFGYLIGNGDFVPLVVHLVGPQLPTVQRALSSLLIFIAGTASLLIAILALADSLRDAWRKEQAAYSRLVGERDFAESLIETARAIVLVLDRDGRVLRYNRFLAELCGKPLSETYGRDCVSFLLPEACREPIRQRLIESARSYGEWSGMNPVLDAAGNERMIEWHNRTLGGADGRPDGLLSIGIDVTERERAEAELRAVNENLEQLVAARTAELSAGHEQLVALNAAKDRLFSIIGHDLRNPFQAFIGYAELLQGNAAAYSAAEIADIAALLHKAAQNSRQLLDNLLAWARSQTGNIAYDPRPLDLAQLAAAAVSQASMTAQARGVTVESAVPVGLWVPADADMLATVLRNLVSNALKFTVGGGTVRVEGRALDDAVELTVVDSGCGLSAADRDKLFRLEVPNSEIGPADKEKGTGLGLILCREFVDRHRGRIIVESAPGQGSRFTVRLPRV